MPWKEADVMNQKTEFALRAFQGEEMSELCREFGISRQTGYKWKERFAANGRAGLAELSRRPKGCPAQLEEDVVLRIVKLKNQHRRWGPKKVRDFLLRHEPGVEWPSLSSFKRVLDKAGLVEHRRRRPTAEAGVRLVSGVKAERPNQVWTVDFKGWWYTQDRSRFEPLTIRDDYSRFVLAAQALESSRTDIVREAFERVFQEYGLPEVIHSDNGSPFAACNSPLGLSRLSAWWLTLGIDLNRGRPGHPQDNGAHERMHRDIAVELEGSPEKNALQQQAALDEWRKIYNLKRPHEALAMQVPKDFYRRSKRKYDGKRVELIYPTGQLVRKVSQSGDIKVHSQTIRVSTALAGFDVGLEGRRENRFAVWFCRLCLGEIDLATQRFTAVSGE